MVTQVNTSQHQVFTKSSSPSRKSYRRDELDNTEKVNPTTITINRTTVEVQEVGVVEPFRTTTSRRGGKGSVCSPSVTHSSRSFVNRHQGKKKASPKREKLAASGSITEVSNSMSTPSTAAAAAAAAAKALCDRPRKGGVEFGAESFRASQNIFRQRSEETHALKIRTKSKIGIQKAKKKSGATIRKVMGSPTPTSLELGSRWSPTYQNIPPTEKNTGKDANDISANCDIMPFEDFENAKMLDSLVFGSPDRHADEVMKKVESTEAPRSPIAPPSINHSFNQAGSNAEFLFDPKTPKTPKTFEADAVKSSDWHSNTPFNLFNQSFDSYGDGACLPSPTGGFNVAFSFDDLASPKKKSLMASPVRGFMPSPVKGPMPSPTRFLMSSPGKSFIGSPSPRLQEFFSPVNTKSASFAAFMASPFPHERNSKYDDEAMNDLNNLNDLNSVPFLPKAAEDKTDTRKNTNSLKLDAKMSSVEKPSKTTSKKKETPKRKKKKNLSKSKTVDQSPSPLQRAAPPAIQSVVRRNLASAPDCPINNERPRMHRDNIFRRVPQAHDPDQYVSHVFGRLMQAPHPHIYRSGRQQHNHKLEKKSTSLAGLSVEEFYERLACHREAFERCTFILPGFKDAVFRKSSCTVKSESQTVATVSPDRFDGSISDETNKRVQKGEDSTVIATRRIASAICAFGGQVRRKDPTKKPESHYTAPLLNRFYEHDSRISWDVEEEPPVESPEMREARKRAAENDAGESDGKKIRMSKKGDDDDDEDAIKMKYRCKLCGKPKQNHSCPFQKSLQRSIGITVHSAINAFTAAEPGVLAPALGDMNNFVSNKSDSQTMEMTPSRPSRLDHPSNFHPSFSDTKMTPGPAPFVTPEMMRPSKSPSRYGHFDRYGVPIYSYSMQSPSRNIRRRNIMSPEKSKACFPDKNNSVFVAAVSLSNEQFREVQTSDLSDFEYPHIPLPYTQRRNLSDNLFKLSKELPQIREECATMLKQAREDEKWDIVVAELLTQVIVAIHCPPEDRRLEGLSRYLNLRGFAC